MKKSGLLLAAVVFAVLLFFKNAFPETADGIISAAGQMFSGDLDYRSVIGGLEDSLSVFRDDSAHVEKAIEVAPETSAHSVRSEEVYTVLISEAGVNTGESSPHEHEPPEVVTAFLETQEPYTEYGLPENVSYEYCPYPGETAVPVAGYNSSGFGYRIHPIKGEVRFHYGTDFAAWTGEDILAFADGSVTFAGYSDSYGNYITVDHGEGWETLYAHCSELMVSTGDKVSAGDRIALVGGTGLATGPHLHFELMHEGVYVNPEYYVN